MLSPLSGRRGGAGWGIAPPTRVRPLVLLLLAAAAAQPGVGGRDLVAPGGLAQYNGGEQRLKKGRISAPAEGFFIGGSSIHEMNGVYARVHRWKGLGSTRPVLAYRKWPIRERDDLDGWLLALVEAPETEEGEEWLIVDSQKQRRFWHKGGTIIPGAGRKWAHREAASGGAGQQRRHRPVAVPALPFEPGEGDINELPWQVIFISTADRVNAYRWEEDEHHQRGRRLALTGGSGGGGDDSDSGARDWGRSADREQQEEQEQEGLWHCTNMDNSVGDGWCFAGDAGALESRLEAEFESTAAAAAVGASNDAEQRGHIEITNVTLLLLGKAHAAFGERSYANAAQLYTQARLAWPAASASAADDGAATMRRYWAQASLHRRTARSQRLSRDFSSALEQIQSALRLFPRSRTVLHEHALLLLDHGRAAAALGVWKSLLKMGGGGALRQA